MKNKIIPDFKVGDKINLSAGYRIEIMAICKGYVMARYKGAVPFVKDIKEMDRIIKEHKTE
jgi:hypothetical protein